MCSYNIWKAGELKLLITLAELDCIASNDFRDKSFILESSTSFRIKFDTIKVFQKPDLICFKNNNGEYYYIKENEIEYIEYKKDNCIYVHTDKSCDNVIRIIPINTI